MHLKIAVLLLVLVCSAGLGEESLRKKRSSNSEDPTPQSSSSSESSHSAETQRSSDLSPKSQSSSSHNSPKSKTTPRSCLERQFKRRRECEKCGCVDCYACQQNYHNNKYKCALVYCDSVLAPANGEVTASSNHECGSYLQYTCHDGYQRVGPEWRTCQSDGNWDKNAPVCKAICSPLCPPSNGFIDMTQGNLAGDTVTYGCDHDFYLVGAEERTCLNNGTWDSDDPHCEPVVRCPELCNPDNGYILYTDTTVGSVATFGCLPDYVLSDNENRTCGGSGNWSSPSPVCTSVVRCTKLCDPNNGYTLYHDTTVGSVATFGCLPEYELSDNENRTCEASGNWSSPSPVCNQVVRCPELCNPDNGYTLYPDTTVGSEATFGCLPDYELSDNENRTCGANGNWNSPSPVCTPVVRCTKLCDPNNGYTLYHDTIVGSVATFGCLPEYELSDNENRTCGANGNWSSPSPVCNQVVRCPELCNPNNGYTLYPDTTVGSVAVFGCLPDYELSDNVNRTCGANGNWSSPSPVCTPVVRCPRLCDPNNGYTLYLDTTFSSVATFGCLPEYELSDNENRTCGANGNWSSPSPVCNQVVRCPELCNPDNGYTLYPDTTVGSVAMFGCLPDFELSDNDNRTCGANGNWSSQSPVCTPVVRCPKLCDPNNGYTLHLDTTVGSVATFGCHPDYELSDNENRTCEGSGNWSSPSPVCTPVVRCPELCNPDNGYALYPDTTVGSVAVFGCLPDYELSDNENRTCGGSGNWSSPSPVCTPVVRCTKLCDPNNGYTLYHDTIVGSVATFGCLPEYELSDNENRTCGANGNWSSPSPVCNQVVRCPELCNPDNGYKFYTDTTVGSVATFGCLPDYELSDNEIRTCGGSGNWSSPSPVCTPVVRCTKLCDPNNGYTLYHDTIVGSVATFGCLPEYELSDNENRTCGANGNWSSPSPLCNQVVRCPQLCNPDNGYTFYTDTTVGSVATFGCLPDYELSDNENRTCGGSGNWSSPSPVCTPVVRCTKLCDPNNGYTLYHDTIVGSVATFGCHPDYELSDNENRTCGANGNWSSPSPVCTQVVRCPNLCDPNNGAVDFYDTTVGSVAMYTCNEGFNLSGAVNRDCQANGTWSPSEPICIPVVQCPWLSSPIDGRLEVFGNTVGSTALYECNFGFTLFGEYTRECNANGTWVPKLPPTCHPERNCANRWYMVYENDDNGVGLTGGFNTLVNALTKGAEVRVRFPFYGIVAPLQNVIPLYNVVCGQIIFSMEKDDYDRFQSSAIWHFKYVCTSSDFDKLLYNYGEYISTGHNHNMRQTQWFIRERCHSKPLLSDSEDDYENSGSVLSVIDAMKLGQDIHVTINGTQYSVSVDNIEYNEVEDEVVAMDIWQITNVYAGNHFRFSNNPSWMFSLYSSSRMVKESLWQIGDHVNLGSNSFQAYSMSWYANDCWDHVYDNDENGMAQNGLDINDLRAKASNGHKIKLMYNRTLISCDEVLLKDDHVCCTCFNKLSKSGLDEFPSDVYHIPEIACTNGWINRLLIKIGSNEMGNGITEERASISWFADVRPWKKVASISKSGVVNSGSKEIFKHAVENGADVRYKVKFSSAYHRIVTPDHIEINGNNWGAMHIRSVSIQFDNVLVVKLKPVNPFLWATIMADNGRMDKFRWILGEHTPRNHNSDYHPTQWFVNY